MKGKDMKSILYWVSFVLLAIGGLNWGLVGLAGFDLVKALFGTGILTSITYVIVSIATIVFLAMTLFKMNK